MCISFIMWDACSHSSIYKNSSIFYINLVIEAMIKENYLMKQQ
jgi:hypothetical protein